MSLNNPDIVACSRCGRNLIVEVEPEEKPDGNMVGYRIARCSQCGNVMDEEEIEELL